MTNRSLYLTEPPGARAADTLESVVAVLVAESDEHAAGWAALAAAREGDLQPAKSAMATIESIPDSVPQPNYVVAGRTVYLARLAAVMGDRDRAVGYIRKMNERTGGRLSRHAQHPDFRTLSGYAPYERVTRPFP